MDRLSIDEKISLSNIGFRSETGIKELVKIKEGKEYNQFYLEDSRAIVNYFDSIINGEFPLISHPPVIYFKLLFDNPTKEKVESIKKTKSILEKIAKNENVSPKEIDEGIDFFSKLSQKCLEYLDINSQI
jgi:hypothetical protein